MANNIQIYTCILVFGQQYKKPFVVTDINGTMPKWIVHNTERQTLDIVRDGFYNISGVSPSFYGHINQAGTFEFWDGKYKELYIVYSLYFPDTFDLSNTLYKWTSLTDLDNDNKIINIIRYIYGSRK